MENAIRRLELRTDYEPTVRGRARQLTRRNAYELAALNALVKAGVKPSWAIAVANDIFVFEAYARHGRSLPEFLAFPHGDHGRITPFAELTPDTLKELREAAPQSSGFSIVATGDLKRRVDALFGWEW